MLIECANLPAVNGVRCQTGEAKITGSGRIMSKFIIHTVGPVYHCSDDPAGELAACYRNSIDLAQANNCRSIAFPEISTGVYGYPKEEAREIAMQVCQEYKDQIEIHLYRFG